MATSALDELREQLRDRMRHEPRPVIAERAGLNKYWLEKFSQGVIDNPAFVKIERLRTYLALPFDEPKAVSTAAFDQQSEAA